MKGRHIIGEQARAAIDKTIRSVAERHGVKVSDVLSGGKCRKPAVVAARGELILTLAAEYVQTDPDGPNPASVLPRGLAASGLSWRPIATTGIAKILGMDHSTVVLARQRIARRRAEAACHGK